MALDLSRKPTQVAAGDEALLGAMFGGKPFRDSELQTIPISKMHPWSDAAHPRQPFNDYSPAMLRDLAENIEQNGISEPPLLRPHGAGYQIIAGHHRIAAAKLIGMTEVAAIVRTMDDDTAAKLMVDTNLYRRDKLLPSELCRAFAIKAEIANRQGHRTDLTCGHDVHKCEKSRDGIGEEHGMSGRNAQRYMKLGNLLPSLLQKVDDGSLALVAGNALAELHPIKQELVLQVMEDYALDTIKPRQADELRREKERLTEDIVIALLELSREPKEKPQMLTLKIPMESLPLQITRSYVPDEKTLMQIISILAAAV